MKHLLWGLIIVSLAAFSGCSEKEADTNGAGKTDQKINSGIIDFIRNSTLAGFPSETIGHAFDSYKHLTSKEWSATAVRPGYFSIDFQGRFELPARDAKSVAESITGRGLEAKFMMNPDGSFYLFTLLMVEYRADGTISRSEIQNPASALKSIYANKKLEL